MDPVIATERAMHARRGSVVRHATNGALTIVCHQNGTCSGCEQGFKVRSVAKFAQRIVRMGVISSLLLVLVVYRVGKEAPAA